MSRRLSPIDIQHAEFSRRLGGYDRREVRAFLERLSLEVEESLREVQQLRQELDEMDDEVARLRDAEADLQRAVIAAERIASELKENAKREAQLMLQEADRQRRERLFGIEEGMHQARADLSRMERERSLFREQFRGMLQGYLRSLDAPEPAATKAPSDGRRPSEAQGQARREGGAPSDALLDDTVKP